MSHAASPNPEVKKRASVNIQYLTPPASAEIKHKHFFKARRVEDWDVPPSRCLAPGHTGRSRNSGATCTPLTQTSTIMSPT